MKSLETPITQFTTNSLSKNPKKTILKEMFLGMALMFIGISLGLPSLFSVILLIGGILLIFGREVGKINYALYPNGIHQEIKNFIPFYLRGKIEKRFIQWSQIESFKIDFEFSRSLKEYEFLKLYLTIHPKEIMVTDQLNPNGFMEFKQAFLQKMEGFAINNSVNNKSDQSFVRSKLLNKNPVPSNQTNHPIVIRQRKGFYDTLFAKILTIFFVFLTLGLITAGVLFKIQFTSWFKIAFVMIPGTSYMCYRVFFYKKTPT